MFNCLFLLLITDRNHNEMVKIGSYDIQLRPKRRSVDKIMKAGEAVHLTKTRLANHGRMTSVLLLDIPSSLHWTFSLPSPHFSL